MTLVYARLLRHMAAADNVANVDLEKRLEQSQLNEHDEIDGNSVSESRREQASLLEGWPVFSENDRSLNIPALHYTLYSCCAVERRLFAVLNVAMARGN